MTVGEAHVTVGRPLGPLRETVGHRGLVHLRCGDSRVLFACPRPIGLCVVVVLDFSVISFVTCFWTSLFGEFAVDSFRLARTPCLRMLSKGDEWRHRDDELTS
ncbi:hypothetical protein NL676_002747 [Syzygium grande]|nr:hypothetical protein NL676_002747 [Syzygium grande]